MITIRATTPALRQATRVTIVIAMAAKTPAHQQQQCLCICNGTNTARREAVARREVEAMQRDARQQPAGANKEGGSRMNA